MKKIVREADYFKEITHQQIDARLRFLQRALGETFSSGTVSAAPRTPIEGFDPGSTEIKSQKS